MLHIAMQAFAYENTNMARTLQEKDDEVDALYERAFSEMMAYMAEESQQSEVQSAYDIIRVDPRVGALRRPGRQPGRTHHLHGDWLVRRFGCR